MGESSLSRRAIDAVSLPKTQIIWTSANPVGGTQVLDMKPFLAGIAFGLILGILLGIILEANFLFLI